jgi:ATP-binding cassette subfamily F protein uup
MSCLLSIHSLTKSFGTQPLFSNISFTISQGARIGLIGPNGCGKTTLLKILMGEESPDSGYISQRQGLRCAYASQSPLLASLSIEDILVQACPDHDEHEARTRARILLGKLRTPFDNSFLASSLSGGWKKRIDIARSLMTEPDLLLLDEPTNHLDLEGILWLEQFLRRESISYLLVSHDRYFLENACTSIIELNSCFPGGLFACDGTMSVFMERKEQFLQAQAQRERGLRSTVRGEEAWLRRSPAARTTKSRSRIQKAYELTDELAQTSKMNASHTIDLAFSASERETRKLLAAKNISKSLGGRPLFRSFDFILSPGSRVGVVGRNGTGKTTLLKVLAGHLPCDTGTIKYADALKLVYFDQHREQLPLDCTLRHALSPNGDYVDYRGQLIHVNGWAKKFLFHPDRLGMSIKYLSGGERARILLARLMLEPADILFLDEPTNDLDIATLEIIEESLLQFPGAVVLISHDRCLMDRVCTTIVGLGDGHTPRILAGYDQWVQSCQTPPDKEKPTPSPVAQPQKTTRLTYKEQRELAGMEEAIAAQEQRIAGLQQQIAQASDTQHTAALYSLLAQAQQECEALFSRWTELETRS